MKLTNIDICKNRCFRQAVRQLYTRAFPKEERIPWWLLWLNACRNGVDLCAWQDGDTFCGMTSSVTVGNVHFLLFFAVAENCRGRGYGSEILRLLRQRYQTVVLNVEPLTDTAPNLAQRKRRFAFYERNGFVDTGWYVWEIGGKFRVLSTEASLNVPAYKKLFRKLTFGLWDVRLKEEKRS